MAYKLLLTSGLCLARTAAEKGGIPWWVWLLIIVVLILLIWWWWDRRAKKGAAVAESAPPPPPPPAPPPAPAAPPQPDDLTIIEGIGPKIAGLLNEAGITTFAQLAGADVAQLREMLVKANLRIADPATWSEQARLAAAGQWDELRALQDQLKGGRQR